MCENLGLGFCFSKLNFLKFWLFFGYIQAWEKLPLGDESGKFIEDIPIKEAIEAIKKYPGVPFPEAVKKFRNPSKR